MVVNSVRLVNKPKLISKHQYGGNFYKKWRPWEIARLQRFLAREDKMGDKAYQGEEDGVMNQELFEAIKNYQRMNNLRDVDGLWGYNTNLKDRVFMSDTLDRGSYKPNQKTDMGWAKPGLPKITQTTVDDLTQKELDEIMTFYYMNPDLLYADTDSNPTWRQIFHNSGKWGSDFLNQIAAMIPEEKRKKIDPKKLTLQWKTDNVKDAIYEGQKKVMPGLLTALAAPVVIGGVAAPLLGGAAVETLAGLGGSYVGAKVGGAVGKQIGGAVADTDKVYSDPVQSRYGAVSVIHDPKRAIQEAERTGEFVGSMVGGALGGASGNALGAGARKQVINTMGAGRASYKPKTRFSSPTETTAEPFGNIKLGDVKGISKPRLFMKGVKARISPQPGQTRAGGVYGIKHNSNPHYNPGTWSDTKTIEAATKYWNNPQAPTKIVFGGSQNLSRGVKIGQAMELNWPGIGHIAGYMAPAYGYTSIFNTEYQTTPRNRDKKKDKSKKATE